LEQLFKAEVFVGVASQALTLDSATASWLICGMLLRVVVGVRLLPYVGT
jgi:hypothetical protein